MNTEKINLNLIHQLVLLALDDIKGTFVSDSLSFRYGIAGAVIFELSIEGSIELKEKKIKVIKEEKLNDEILDYCFEIIKKSKKERTIRYWLQVLGKKENLLKEIAINKLISQEILTKKEGKFLWIFSNNKFPTKNVIPENQLRARLYDIVRNNKEPKLRDIMLISLIDSCKLNRAVYGKEIAKDKKEQIKSIIKKIQLTDSTNIIIKEIHDSIIAAITVVIATTTINT